MILPQKIEIQPGPCMLGSKLGWILSGRASETFENTTVIHANTDTWKTDTQGNNISDLCRQITPHETKFRRFLEVRNYRNK